MIRWRLCLALACLLLLPEIDAKADDDDEEDSDNKEELKIPNIQKLSRRGEEAEEDDDDDDEDEEEEGGEKLGGAGGGGGIGGIGGIGGGGNGDAPPMLARRPLPIIVTKPPMTITQTTKKRPLECYVCAYKSETPLRACLDPTKFRVHTITCHSVDDQCFTSVISKNETYEAVVRGCRSACVGSPETTCCDLNRCNNQAFAMPLIQPRAALTTSLQKEEPPPPPPIIISSAGTVNKSCFPPTILFFVSILLVLQTVSKVLLV